MSITDYILHLNEKMVVPSRKEMMHKFHEYLVTLTGENAVLALKRGHQVLALEEKEPDNVYYKEKGKWYKGKANKGIRTGSLGRVYAVSNVKEHQEQKELLDSAKKCHLTLCTIYINNLANSLLQEVIRYVKQRHTFDKPLSSYQLVIDQIVLMQTEVSSNNCFLMGVILAATGQEQRIDEKLFFLEVQFLIKELYEKADKLLPVMGAYGVTDESSCCQLYHELTSFSNLLLEAEETCLLH
ncbi:acyl-CoA dehydrogenase family protein [Bacillus halotolerans]|uniref:acyl-CoA dehydrogenase family protein n=1 Tax=Bacillus halotolerans TaxID=260554 RepID=UPI00403EFBCE